MDEAVRLKLPEPKFKLLSRDIRITVKCVVNVGIKRVARKGQN